MKPTLNNPVQKIIIHHTAVSHGLNPDQWVATNADHKARFDFMSSLGYYVGYTYEISATGQVRQARKEGEETAAVIGENRRSISICLDGNFDMEMPTLAQAQALKKLMTEIIARWGLTPHKIFPHRDFCGTPPYKSCYGNLLPDNWGQLVCLYDNLDQLLARPLGGIYQPRMEAE